MFPPSRPFKSIRLARIVDVPRLGVVAAAGFYHSNLFTYERPFYSDFPHDTLASYRDMFHKTTIDPNVVVIVVEDEIDKNEVRSVYDSLAKVYPPWSDQLPPDNLEDGRAIVGIASLSFQHGSVRYGQFQPDGNPDLPADSELRGRDKNRVADKLLDNATHEVHSRLFGGHMIVETVVVHPAYWRRGHASKLMQWFFELAEIDQVGIGVEAVRSGVPLYKHLGFQEKQTVELLGYEDHPGLVDIWFFVRDLDEHHPGLRA